MASFSETVHQLYHHQWFTFAIIALALAIIYLAYYLKFSRPHFLIKGQFDISKKNIRKPPPPYPNGWYNIARSKEIPEKGVRTVDVNGHNIVVYRGADKQLYALAAYCLHMGANLGIGGQVVNSNCIMCPFHGWLYNGETGQCVDHDKKPLKLKSIEYNDCLGQKGSKLQWQQKQAEIPTLKKYHVIEMNGYVYVWIHAMEQLHTKPEYPMLNVESFIKPLKFRGTTQHHINCHLQDIPSNGADVLHFKYVHTYLTPLTQAIYFRWQAKWKIGSDPDIAQMFEHPRKEFRDFKQRIYHQLVENYPRKEILSIGNLQNWIRLPILGQYYMFTATIIQVGLGIVFIILKAPLYEIVFHHYIRPVGRNQLEVFHDAFTSGYLPYLVSAKIIQGEGGQVTNDMYIWEAKSFARKTFLNESKESDQIMRDWLKWSGQFYQGCSHQQDKQRYSW